eukprot:176603_1
MFPKSTSQTKRRLEDTGCLSNKRQKLSTNSMLPYISNNTAVDPIQKMRYIIANDELIKSILKLPPLFTLRNNSESDIKKCAIPSTPQNVPIESNCSNFIYKGNTSVNQCLQHSLQSTFTDYQPNVTHSLYPHITPNNAFSDNSCAIGSDILSSVLPPTDVLHEPNYMVNIRNHAPTEEYLSTKPPLQLPLSLPLPIKINQEFSGGNAFTDDDSFANNNSISRKINN